MSVRRIAEVGERLTGGAGEATLVLSDLLASDGYEVRLYSADSVDNASLAAVSRFGDWSKLYEMIDRINSKSKQLGTVDPLVRQYHAMRHRFAEELKTRLRAFDPDIVHFHNVSAVLSPITAIEIAEEWPLVWTLHDRWVFDLFHNEWVVGSDVVRTWEKSIGDQVSCFGHDLIASVSRPIDFIAPSVWMKTLAASSPLAERHRLHEVPNPVSMVDPASLITPLALREALEVDFVILSVIPKLGYSLKGYHDLRRAFVMVQERVAAQSDAPRIGLVVLTGQSLNMPASHSGGAFNLRDLAARGLTKGDTYLGQDMMRDLYTAVDALVIPSRIENLPNVAVEAIRDGCPVVATKVGGLSELFELGDIGYGVSPGAPHELADAIIEVVLGRGRADFAGSLEQVWASSLNSALLVKRIEEVFKGALENHIGERSRAAKYATGR